MESALEAESVSRSLEPMPVLIALFVVYVVAVTWQMRRAVAALDLAVRQREARRLLLVVSAGVPLLGAFVWVVM